MMASSFMCSLCATDAIALYRRRPLAERNQQGFGLIELMISLAIASFLVLGLVAMSGSMQTAYTQQTNLAALHDKERFASALFANVLQAGGYSTVSYSPTAATEPARLDNSILAQVLVANPPGQVYGTSQYIAASGAASGNGPDVLNVRYYDAGSDKPGANCLGASYGTGSSTYESVLSISGTNLICQVGVNAGTPAATPGGAAGTSVVLLDGVSNMQLLFNILYTSGPNAGQYQYLRAIDMTSALWTSVKSVTVKLTFSDSTVCVGATPPPICTFSQTYQVMYGAP